GTVVLQAGEDPEFAPEAIATLIQQLKNLGLAVTLSLGEWDRQTYLLWKQAGADRYL
ncbi:MAG TPA: [FeFe] hydrogenase H-cluster radical SAM maturase HydE, partial [Firmicutes bacterium]|nr:[FeFe] hydrogenase H-cluster radical SAM maturase HydE [Bacillota bacterium]